MTKSRPVDLIFYLKVCNYDSKSLWGGAINLLDLDVGFSDFEPQLLSIVGIYDIDLAAAIKQNLYLFLLESDRIMDAKHPDDNLFIIINYQHGGCRDQYQFFKGSGQFLAKWHFLDNYNTFCCLNCFTLSHLQQRCPLWSEQSFSGSVSS